MMWVSLCFFSRGVKKYSQRELVGQGNWGSVSGDISGNHVGGWRWSSTEVLGNKVLCQLHRNSLLLYEKQSIIFQENADVLRITFKWTHCIKWGKRNICTSRYVHADVYIYIYVFFSVNSTQSHVVFTESHWVGRDPQGSLNPTLKWIANSGIEPTPLMLLSPCCKQVS